MQQSRIVLALVCVALLTVPMMVSAQNVFTDFANSVTGAFNSAVNGTVNVANDVAKGATGAYGTAKNATVGATVGAYNSAVNGVNHTAQSALGINSAEHVSAVRIGAIVAALPLAMWALL